MFSYTATDHRKRFEQCAYTKEEYTARRDSARVVKEAFATGSTQKLNSWFISSITALDAVLKRVTSASSTTP